LILIQCGFFDFGKQRWGELGCVDDGRTGAYTFDIDRYFDFERIAK
jgi:hypothetical protein